MLPNHYGKIVNISSSDGKMPGRGVSIYGAAKAGVISLTKSFAEELKHSGTIDFILSDAKGTTVLSVQEQYLANDNISEIIGGHFKVLGKVISICKEDTENIDLLRKTSLTILQEDLLNDMFSGFKTEDMKQFNLPELKTKITSPAAIVIPIAIYA